MTPECRAGTRMGLPYDDEMSHRFCHGPRGFWHRILKEQMGPFCKCGCHKEANPDGRPYPDAAASRPYVATPRATPS